MTLINPIDAGMAASNSESFTTVTLVTGDFPQHDTSEVVAASVIATDDLPALTVVGRDSSGEIVPAVLGGGNAVAPIGITINTVKAGATNRTVAVYRAGCYNPDALVWDSSYDTDAKKRVAFEASQPTLFLRKAAAF